MASVNSLISTQKSADAGLQVALHPLPILEISDYITRSYLRGYNGAVVGALLGQQNGRDITIEHSFSLKSAKNAEGIYELDYEWFLARLEQSQFPVIFAAFQKVKLTWSCFHHSESCTQGSPS